MPKWMPNFLKKDVEGLGDIIENLTQATGIKKVANKVFKNCKCAERRKKLNELFPIP